MKNTFKKITFIMLLSTVLAVSVFADDFNTLECKEISAKRLEIQVESYLMKKIVIKDICINSIVDKNTVYFSQNGSAYFANISDSAMDWLLDYMEKDSRWSSRRLNIYGICIKGKYDSFIHIEKIEFW